MKTLMDDVSSSEDAKKDCTLAQTGS